MAMGADTVAMVEATPVGKLCLLMAYVDLSYWQTGDLPHDLFMAFQSMRT